MGLDDIQGVGKSGSSRSSPNRQSSQDDEEEVVQTVSHGSRKKKFTEEAWDKVKTVIRDEFEYTVEEVLNNLSSSKRYEVVHEAATWNPDDLTEEQENLKTERRCVVCGKATSHSEVTTEIDGQRVHTHHTVAQLDKALRDK